MGGDALLLVALVVLFAASMVVAAAETAIIRIPESRAVHLAETGRRGAQRLLGLVRRLPEVLNAVLLAALLAQIGAATITGILAERRFGSLGVTIASVTLTLLMYIYAEAIPKTFAVQHPDRTALALSGFLSVIELALRPFVKVLVWFADIQMPGKGITTSPTITEGELRSLARSAALEGEITPDDNLLIERAFTLGDRRVDDIMVPRADIVGVHESASVTEAIDVALTSGHRRVVLHSDDGEEIVGVVRLRDLVALPAERRDMAVASLADEPLVVPETKRVLALLRDMQASRIHLAVVVDEYGGTAGIVTIEDIVEELVGSVSDDDTPEAAVPLGDHRWSIDGRLPVEDLEALTGVTLPEGSWNTAAGLAMGMAGRVLEVGDEVVADGLRLRVSLARRRRIIRLEVEEIH